MFGNFAGVQHAHRRFHHRPDAQITCDCCKSIQLRGTFDLRQQNRVAVHFRHSLGIGFAPDGIKAVDAHDAVAMTEPTLCQFACQSFACIGLLVDCNGIFEVKDDRIYRQAARFVDRAILGTGDVQNRPEGAWQGHGCVSFTKQSCVSTFIFLRKLQEKFAAMQQKGIPKSTKRSVN